MTARHKALWLTLHEPREFTLGWLLFYAALFGTGIGTVIADHGQLPLGVFTARHVAAYAFIVGAGAAFPFAWRGIWWAERIFIPIVGFGLFARILAILAMGDTTDDGHTALAVGAWVALFGALIIRGVWVKISPYRIGAGPQLAHVEATLARARLEETEREHERR